MTNLENAMVQLLIDLRDNHNVVEVKAEFETEASRMDELLRLKEIVGNVKLGLVIKIGGAEAITDMFAAQNIGVSGLIVPMIESPYAMSKYLGAIKKYFLEEVRKNIHFGVNIETYQGYTVLDKILNLPSINLIDTITLGRVDMSGSLGIGLTSSEINSDKIYIIAEKMFSKAKKRGYRTTLGGGIAKEAIPFIKKLVGKKLLDRFETRKIVFKVPNTFAQVELGIIKANKFELLWLENKRNYYAKIFHEDESRIEMLKKRVNM